MTSLQFFFNFGAKIGQKWPKKALNDQKKKIRLGYDKNHLKQYIPTPYPQVCAAPDRLRVARVLQL